MKLITDLNMRAFTSLTASGSAAGFPASNLQLFDPGLVWKADAFASDATLVADLGAVTDIERIWLNNANFLSATLQANDSNSWGDPAVSISAILAEDDVGIIKGFFDLSAVDYRYVRVVIPVQALTDGESLPSLGNLIIGTSEELKVASWDSQTIRKFSKFEPDDGGYRKTYKGRARHIFAASVSGTKAEVDAVVLKGWDVAIIFTDLGVVSDSYLVYAPDSTRGSTRNAADAERSFTLEELA
jgi:hypothetical protein